MFEIAVSTSFVVANPFSPSLRAVFMPSEVTKPLVASVIFKATSARDKPGLSFI